MRAHPSITLLIILAGGSSLLLGCAAKPQPAVQREPIEWCNVWVPNTDKEDLPRVLLIGDSITQAYFPEVESRLAGKAYCARLTTSKCIGDPGLLAEIEPLLDQYRFAIIHVNNGLHGVAYTEEQYAQAFEPFMNTLMTKEPQARMIWAHSTPVVIEGKIESPRTARVRVRNQTAQAFADRRGIPVDDLFALTIGHPEYFSTDGVHLNKTGISIQAKQVAEVILATLEK